MSSVDHPLTRKRIRSFKDDLPSPNTDSGIHDNSVASTPYDECPDRLLGANGDVTSSSRFSLECLASRYDEVMDTEDIMTWRADQPVKLRTAETGTLSEKPVTIMTAFQRTVARFPHHPALAYKSRGRWVKITYQEYYEMVVQAAKAFIQIGLEMHNGVGILGFNSPEWFISYLAGVFAGGLSTGIYTTNTADACRYVIDNARCDVVIVENNSQLQKILSVRHQLPHLKAIVQYNGELEVTDPNVYSWSSFMELASKVSDDELYARWLKQAPNKCCSLIYTSGTTGDSKGVMLSHDNLVWTAVIGGRQGRLKFADDELVSYLPLSHVAAQILDIFIPLTFASTVYFAQPDALKGSLGDTLKEVRPTVFLGVPRVWEKMQEKMISIGRVQWTVKRKLVDFAKYIGIWGNMSTMNGGAVPYGWSLANILVFQKVRQALGFDRCKFCMTAAAPIMKDTLDFFMSLNLPLMEIYGMSESSGPHTLSFPWKYRTVSAGSEIEGCQTKLSNPDDEGTGEVCMNGRNIFMGYLNMEDKTKEAFDEEGWLRSGDIGRKDGDGYLYITGRIKELLITAGGENIAPVPIEDLVKEQLPCLSNCMLVGDQRKFLALLMTLKTEVDPNTSAPTDKLAPATIDWCKGLGCEASTLSKLRENMDQRILKAIQGAVDGANRKAISRAQVIQKWSILPRDFSIFHGELGPTLKLKRAIVGKMYKQTIDAFYTEPE